MLTHVITVLVLIIFSSSLFVGCNDLNLSSEDETQPQINSDHLENLEPGTNSTSFMDRPLVGGLQIEGYDGLGNIFSRCTYSFNANRRSGGRYWLTNSHCTRGMYSVNPLDEYYQSDDDDGAGAYIGAEIQDPGGFECLPSYTCRYSDSALLGLPENQSWDFGEIARTEYNASPGEGAGSIVIDTNNPRFIIVDEAEGADYFEGLWLSKVGRTTGWTIGEITETCATINDYPNNGDLLLCQVLTTYYSAGGDSGSPVHASPYGWPDVDLYGIHWGSFTGGNQERIFSRISGVQEDHGHLRTHGRVRD